MVKKNTDYTNIPKEKFEFYKRDESIHDKKLETKPVGYFKDAMRRFAKNKSSVVADDYFVFISNHRLCIVCNIYSDFL